MPTVPVKAAGWRMEPPVSVAVAPRQSRAATAAADPGGTAGDERRVRILAAPGRDDVAEGAGLVGRAHGELIEVELAEHHGTIAPEIGRHRRFVMRLEALEDLGARRRLDALGAEQVLDAERDALQRAGLAGGDLRVRRVGHRQRAVGRFEEVGVQRPRLGHGVEMRARQLAGGEGLRLQGVPRLGEGEFVGAAHASQVPARPGGACKRKGPARRITRRPSARGSNDPPSRARWR